MKKIKYAKKRVYYKTHALSLCDMDGQSLEELILYLNRIHDDYEKECFENDLECIFHITQDYDYVEVYLLFTRWETDGEFNKRVEKSEKARLRAAESHAKRKQKKKEIEEKLMNEEYQNYLKLKEKYEPTS